MQKSDLYRALPKVDDILVIDRIIKLSDKIPNEIIKEAITRTLDDIRSRIKNADESALTTIDLSMETIIAEIVSLSNANFDDRLKPVVNASGVVIHTNLGRSVLSRDVVNKAIENAFRYNNLEFDLENGKRGSRYNHLEDLICKVTGAEAAHVVNNNAAAVILVLSELAKGKKIPVSRGELVEIGGSFRIPDIMKISGCELREIGCTNKTHLRDYENAIDEETALILKVHSSNYKMIGFTENPSIEDLSKLAKDKGIPFYYDIGSGSIADLSKFTSFDSPVDEPTVREALSQGVDVVSFSGDKLLGSAQAGIIVGKKEYIERMKKNQLTRALRLDKIIISVLEQSFKAYLDVEKAVKNIPTLRMLSMTKNETKERCDKLLNILAEKAQNLDCQIIEDYSEVGGGSLPATRMPSFVLAIEHKKLSAEKLLKALRDYETPIIARINNERVIIDSRCFLDGDEKIISDCLKSLDV